MLFCLSGCREGITKKTHQTLNQSTSRISSQVTSPNFGLKVLRETPQGHASRMVMVPPKIHRKVLLTRQGDLAARAKLTIKQIIVQQPKPDYLAKALAYSLKQSNTKKQSKQKDQSLNEAPMAAQFSYASGLLQYQAKNYLKAKQHITDALKQVPNDPTLLKLLAELWQHLGSPLRSMDYLKKAFQVDPQNIQTLYLLSKNAMAQRRWAEAVILLDYTASLEYQAKTDAALFILCHYYLATALKQLGYDAAAIIAYQHYLNQPAEPNQSTRWTRQLRVLARQRGRLWQNVGDAYLRLGKPKDAIQAYRYAAEKGVAHQIALVKRILYALLLQGHFNDAKKAFFLYMNDLESPDKMLVLLPYLTNAGVDKANLLESLLPIYRKQQYASNYAIAATKLMSNDQRDDFIKEHLSHRPNDREYYRFLLRTDLPSLDRGHFTKEQLTHAVQLTLTFMAASVRVSNELAMTLIDHIDDVSALQVALQAAIDKHLVEPDQKSSAYLLRGLIAAKQNDPKQAQLAFEKALKLNRDSLPARRLLAGYAILLGRLSQAEQLLKPVWKSVDDRIVALRVKLLIKQNQDAQAFELLQTLIEKYPSNINLLIRYASLQAAQGNMIDAERSLLEALEERPKSEKLYTVLFDLYDTVNSVDFTKQYKRLMGQMFSNIPQSRLAQLKLSEYRLARKDYLPIEQKMKLLLNENRHDYKALALLLIAYQKNHQSKKAEKLIEQYLKNDPNNPNLLKIAVNHYLRNGNAEKEFSMRERLFLLLPKEIERAKMLAWLYLQWKKPLKASVVLKPMLARKKWVGQDRLVVMSLLAKAFSSMTQYDQVDQLYKQALADYPSQEVDLRYEWAMSFQGRGEQARSLELLETILKKYPNEAKVNNGLAYSWATRGIRLEQALVLAKRAVKNEPKRAAYLDSLGWVYYKQGKFNQAVDWLKRAAAIQEGQYPVVLDHLGDALYQAGNLKEAKYQWIKALNLLEYLSKKNRQEDDELKGLKQRLKQKKEAVDSRHLAPVSEVIHVEKRLLKKP